MDCKSIVIGVRHEVRGRVRKDSFFMIDCEPREHFVLEALGECYVDAASMRNFEEWIRGDFKNCHLLVSLDYKYAMVRPCGENGEFFIRAGEELLPMLPYAISGPVKEKLIPVLEREVGPHTDLCLRYGYKPTRKVLQPRIARLPIEQRASVENLDSAIRDAYLEPRKAEADDLILAFLARENAWIGVPQEQHLAVEAELQRLLRDGELWSGGPLHLYDTEGLTLTELTARRKRALKNCEKLWSKFPEAFLEHGETEALERWLHQFDRDEMLELAVVAWYKCPSPAGREKVLAGSADQALRS
jgi:hypothetical protein